jgi:hypothetical protein
VSNVNKLILKKDYEPEFTGLKKFNNEACLELETISPIKESLKE